MYLDSLVCNRRDDHYMEGKFLGPFHREDKRYPHALYAENATSFAYDLDGSCDLFSCQVLLDVTEQENEITSNFLIFVDGELVASARNVKAGQTRYLQTCVRDARKLELRTEGALPAEGAAIWLSPQVQCWPEEGLLDCLGQVRIYRPLELTQADECFVMMISPGYERWLDIFLNSLRQNGNCPAAALIVYCVDGDEACSEVIRKHGANEIKCEALTAKTPTIKPAIFSVGAVARVKKVIAVETDMIVLQNIHTLFESMDVLPHGSLLAAQEIIWEKPTPLEEFFPLVFQGQPEELETVFHADARERAHPLQINGGLIAGTTEAMAALDNTMRDLCPAASKWVQARPDISWREMFVTNFAMARLDAAVSLNPTYNFQLHVRRAQPVHERDLCAVNSDIGRVKILHFSAGSKQQMPELQNYFWEYGNPIHRLREGLAALRSASLTELQNPHFVANIIRGIGLQRPVPHYGPDYGEEKRFINSASGIYLHPMELAEALVYLSDQSIGSYAELGSDGGWTFAFIVAYLHRFQPLSRAFAVNTHLGFGDIYRLREHYPVKFLRGTPTLLREVPFDLVTLNCRSSLPVIQGDYGCVGKHADHCLFYNVDNKTLDAEFQGASMLKWWSEIKNHSTKQVVDFIERSKEGAGMGIGILKNG